MMILRDAVVNNNFYDYHEMNLFGKRGIGNELVYNQGFAFINFIVSEYGENILKDITDELASPLIIQLREHSKMLQMMILSTCFKIFFIFLKEKYSRFNDQVMVW